MVKFVPVTDTETPLSEQQQNNSDYDKHRHFDNPHSLQSKSKKVDRGWQQGNVGWGVLGSFGSNSKDEGAQVASRSDGNTKMVKNEKGLWVKIKEPAVEETRRSGAGRGGGVPVLSALLQKMEGTNNAPKAQSASFASQSSSSQFRDRSESTSPRRDRDDRSRDRGGQRHDSRDRSRRDDRRISRRSRSVSRDRDRGDRRRHSSRDERRPRERSDSRHRDRGGDRDSHARRNDDGDRRREDRGRDERRRDYSRSRSRSRSGARHDSKRHHTDSRSTQTEPPRGTSHKEAETRNIREHSESDGEVNEDSVAAEDSTSEDAGSPFNFSAVQVVNHFHEVFAKDTFYPSGRVDAIAELFHEAASIASLKNEANVYLRDRAAIRDSFLKTAAAEPVISKRVFIDCANDDAAAIVASSGGGGDSVAVVPRVTYCLDMHRAGTAPGLGDKTKDTLLLYRCVGARITSVWGAVDSEKLSSKTDLTAQQVYASSAWKVWVVKVVQRDASGISSVTGADDGHKAVAGEAGGQLVVFHNYDHMEVWG